MEIQKPEEGERWEDEKGVQKRQQKGNSGIIPIWCCQSRQFFISIIFSQHNTHKIQFAVKPFICFLGGSKGSKIGYVCSKWCLDCTVADSLSSLCFSSHSLTRAQGIVVLRWVPVLILHAVHLLELRTGRKLLSTASFRAIFLCQMLTLEPKNRGATVLKLHLSSWYNVSLWNISVRFSAFYYLTNLYQLCMFNYVSSERKEGHGIPFL